MFSRFNAQEGINKQNLKLFNDLIKERQDYVIEQIRPYIDIPKIVFIGMTGSGKSSIICSLSHNELLIKGTSKIMHLEGNGIGNGLKSFTSIPMIGQNMNRQSILVDCPGFEDIDGYVNEILNAFSICNIFKKYPNHQNKFKIMLVISQDEFNTNKGTKMVNSFLRLQQMFPIGEKLKKNIGLVITKGCEDYEGSDYFNNLDEQIKNTEDPPDHLIKICDFFKSHLDQVFVFPRPNWRQKDQQYDFQDRDRLERFLYTELLINPDHKLILSSEAKLTLKILREDHSKKLTNSIQNLCDKIHKQFSQASNSIEIKKWYDIIFNLFQSNIKKTDQLKAFLTRNVPNSQQYKKDLDEIAEYELFDEFIDKILYLALDTSCLNEVIQAWCLHAVYQLNQSLINAIDSEKTQEQLTKLNELRNESEQKIKEFKMIISKNEEDRRKKEKQYLSEIQKLNISHQQYLDQIESLQENINRLQRQLNDQQRNSGSSGGGCLLI